MISYARHKDKPMLVNLWKTCFEQDSDAFVEMYFDHKYDKNHTLIFKEDNQIRAALQMLPYKMNFYGAQIHCAYISGAATLPAYRGRGMMQQLLVYSFREMFKKNVALTILFTQEESLGDFYQKYGYTNAFEHQVRQFEVKEQWKNSKPLFEIEEVDFSNARTAFDFFNRYAQEKNMYVRKTFEDFLVILKDYQLAGGQILLSKENGKNKALTFCLKEADRLIIKKAALKHDQLLEPVVKTLSLHFGVEHVLVFESVSDASLAVTKGMARIIRPLELLDIYARSHPQTAFTVKISDRILLQKDVVLTLKEGRVSPTLLRKEIDFHVDIKQLTQVLLGYQICALPADYRIFQQQHPCMDLMLE